MSDTARLLVSLASVQSAEHGPWLHLVPAGTFRGTDGRGPFHLTDPAGVMAASMQTKRLVVDENHATDLATKTGNPSPARGWIVEMENRADGIWGRVEWTPSGKRLLAERAYRAVSPVLQHEPNGTIKRVLRAALTNDPNLAELATLHAQEANMEKAKLLAALAEVLSLPADADEDAMMAAVRQLLTARNTVDPTRFVPIAMFQQAVAEANKANQGLSRHAAEAAVTTALERRQLMPFARDWAISLCMLSKPAFDDFLAGAGKPMADFIGHLTSPAIADVPQRLARDRGGREGADDETSFFSALGLSEADVKTYGSPRR